jgi:ketosteroid isomerase-like protein
MQAFYTEAILISDQNVDIIQRGFEHSQATGEFLWESFHEEVEVHDHDTIDQGECRGHAGLGRWMEDWAVAWSEFSMEPEEFLDVGERVIMVFRIKATGLSSGVAVERQDAMVFTVRDGKVVRFDYFNNREDALEAVGLAE